MEGEKKIPSRCRILSVESTSLCRALLRIMAYYPPAGGYYRTHVHLFDAFHQIPTLSSHPINTYRIPFKDPAAPMVAPAPGMYHPAAGMAMPMGYRPPPPNYVRAQIAWAEAYDRRMPFIIPPGLPPQVARTTSFRQTFFFLSLCKEIKRGSFLSFIYIFFSI